MSGQLFIPLVASIAFAVMMIVFMHLMRRTHRAREQARRAAQTDHERNEEHTRDVSEH